jgi:hypothetical protein
MKSRGAQLRFRRSDNQVNGVHVMEKPAAVTSRTHEVTPSGILVPRQELIVEQQGIIQPAGGQLIVPASKLELQHARVVPEFSRDAFILGEGQKPTGSRIILPEGAK